MPLAGIQSRRGIIKPLGLCFQRGDGRPEPRKHAPVYAYA